jgi:hypothetical protein
MSDDSSPLRASTTAGIDLPLTARASHDLLEQEIGPCLQQLNEEMQMLKQLLANINQACGESHAGPPPPLGRRRPHHPH